MIFRHKYIRNIYIYVRLRPFLIIIYNKLIKIICHMQSTLIHMMGSFLII
jgi:hypothetical protein